MTAIYYIEVNAICLLIMAMIYVVAHKVKDDARMNAYRAMMIAGMVFCASDMIAGVCRGKIFAGARAILWTSNLLYFVSTFALVVFWIKFSMYVLFDKIQKKVLIVSVIIAALASVFFISTVFNGLCFTINENNLYERGPYIWVQWAVVVPSMAFPAVASRKSKASKRDKTIIALFPIFLFATIFLQIMVYGITVCQVGATLSTVMIYVFLQSQKVNEVETRAALLDELTNMDVLTKLQNRRAYDRRLSELRYAEWVGVMYADINGLKRINDMQSHAAGDSYIKNFANYMRGYFPESDIYRISGDEFVVLSEDRDNFTDLCNQLIEHNGDGASVGYAEGPGENLRLIINQAERKMYSNKDDYYIRTGINRNPW